MEFLKISEVAKVRGGQARSTVYVDVNLGRLPKPVKLGARAVGFPKDEIDAVVGAVACGANDDQIKSLVARLMGERAQRLKSILGGAAA